MTATSFALRALPVNATIAQQNEARFIDACERCYAGVKQDLDTTREPVRQALQDVLCHPVHRPTTARLNDVFAKLRPRGFVFIYEDGELHVTQAEQEVI